MNFRQRWGLQICQLSKAIEERKRLTQLYRQRLSKIEGITLLKPEEIYDDYEYNYSYFPVLVGDAYGKTRDEIYDYLLKRGIYARKYFYPIVPELGCYKKEFGNVDLPIARDVSNRILCLPLFNGMSINELEEVCALLEDIRNE